MKAITLDVLKGMKANFETEKQENLKWISFTWAEVLKTCEDIGIAFATMGTGEYFRLKTGDYMIAKFGHFSMRASQHALTLDDGLITRYTRPEEEAFRTHLIRLLILEVEL